MKGQLKLVLLLAAIGIIGGGVFGGCVNGLVPEQPKVNSLESSNDDWTLVRIIRLVTTFNEPATLSFWTIPASRRSAALSVTGDGQFAYKLYVTVFDTEMLVSEGTVTVSDDDTRFSFVSVAHNTFNGGINEQIFTFEGGVVPPDSNYDRDTVPFQAAAVPTNDEPLITVNSLSLNSATLTLAPDGTATLTATIDPPTAASALFWSSNRPAIVSVSGDGQIQALGEGQATITVTAGGRRAECVVDVLVPAVPGLFLEEDNASAQIDLSASSGTSLLAKAVFWLNTNPGTGQYPSGHDVNYRILLGDAEGETTSGGYTLSKDITVTLEALKTAEEEAAGGSAEAAAGVIHMTGQGALFTVVGTGTDIVPHLILGENITLKGNATNTAALVVVGVSDASKKGNLTMLDGSRITSNTTTGDGGGVRVLASGTFLMIGGSIDNIKSTSNTANGGGVANLGIFTMTGGFIRDNIAGNSSTSSAILGGGVHSNSAGIFTMTGGTISGNKCQTSGNSSGGGVYAYTFTMSGAAVIANNEAKRGGGVRMDANANALFKMEGGTIKGNKALLGAGVLRMTNGKFEKSGGTIYGLNEGDDSNCGMEGAATSGGAAIHAIQIMSSTSATTYFYDNTAGPTVILNGANNNAGNWQQ
ncbi:MAG: Ig-like domain-containing protein [Spirochaetaceae bacterium]|jgi:hypothetical protein|nr:Ig-like domain-containing protein [Spirochaetaceae bacterium]